MTTKILPATLRMVRTAGDEPEAIITTPHEDLMGDEVMPEGMDTEKYMGGPRAVLFAHDMGRLPVARTVSLAKSPGGIRARFRWMDGNPDAAAVRKVYEAGALGASIGFIPHESEPLGRSRGLRFTKTTLTEWSLVPVPANPQCVALVKSLGGRTVPRGGDGLSDAERAFNFDEAFSAPTPVRPGEIVPGVSAADVAAALRETLPALVEHAVGGAIGRAQGRLD
ncbi:MAG: hypothetical protein HY616_04025 [Candidatus Rokubacteria bacterium]|nr:hypothetical protein [Candidatus Rokubacteria bacterium]